MPFCEVLGHEFIDGDVVELLFGVLKELVGVPAVPLDASVLEGGEGDGVAAEQLDAELERGEGLTSDSRWMSCTTSRA